MCLLFQPASDLRLPARPSSPSVLSSGLMPTPSLSWSGLDDVLFIWKTGGRGKEVTGDLDREEKEREERRTLDYTPPPLLLLLLLRPGILHFLRHPSATSVESKLEGGGRKERSFRRLKGCVRAVPSKISEGRKVTRYISNSRSKREMIHSCFHRRRDQGSKEGGDLAGK